MQQVRHVPVLLNEVLEALDPIPNFQVFLDGTFGRGGHSRAILERFSKVKIFGTDRDPEAIEFGLSQFASYVSQGRLSLMQADFSALSQVLNERSLSFDGIMLDLGVSSPQLDQPQRGFSVYQAGPLDMRMDPAGSVAASDIVNTWSFDRLVDLFMRLGEVRRPHRVVEAIVHDRDQEPFTSTVALSRLIERVDGWRQKGHHPATRYFLALRLEVNKEMDQIEQVIPHLIKALNPGGRLLVITFHSLEDRIVKHAFKRALTEGKLVNKKVIQATWPERKANPRARSAKLRIFERT